MLCTQQECIDYIHSLCRFGKKAGLDNITAILQQLGNPQKHLRFVHVAGTNGKGSVTNMTANILISHGYKVGYYTSPYIELFNERICINNNCIPPDKLVEYTNRVQQALGEICPIEFEFITAMGMLYFYEENCDVVVLEVGLGGRFDATNVIDTPLLNIITPIGLDHTAILGDTIEQIAFEKAGTIKQGATVVVHPDMNAKAIAVIRKQCEQTRSKLLFYKPKIQDVIYTVEKTAFRCDGLPIELPLCGCYQVGNAITAIQAALALREKLSLSEQDIVSGIRNAKWKCRFEIFGGDTVTVLDGAHNAHGVKALMESMDLYFPKEKKVFVFSMLNEKDYAKSIKLLEGHCDSVVVTTVPSLRQTDPMQIFKAAKALPCKGEHIENYIDAYFHATELAGSGGVVCMFGSLYLVGAVRKYVENNR